MIPKKIGRYEVERELGRGGMAVVYLVSDPFVRRQVAIKLLPRQFTADPQFRARFQREAQVIASLDHPAIVPIYDFGEHDEQPFIVMRYMPGGTLGQRLRANGPMSPTEAARILTQIGSALDEAHNKGIVHRDLKPGNILFDHRDAAAIADFGIVKLAESTNTLTGTGMIGTPGYMSPEQARGDAHIDRRSDIYALGAILFEMLTGQLPYQADTPMGIAIKHVIDEVPHILRVKPDLPPATDEVITRAMAKEPSHRYGSATELATVISSVAAAQTRPAAPAVDMTQIEMPTAPLRHTAPPAPTTPPQTSRATAPPPQTRRKPPDSSPPTTPLNRPIPAPAAAPAPAVPQPQKEQAKRPAWIWIIGGLFILLFCIGGAIGGVSLASGLFNSRTATATPDSPTEDNPTATIPVADGTTPEATAALLAEAQAATVQVTGLGPTFLENMIGSGSGFVYNAEGLVLTNYHLVEGATTIEITGSDGRTTTAEIVGTSPCDDLALLQLDDPTFPAIPSGAAAIQINSPVLILGYPNNAADQEATAGTVSTTNQAASSSWADFSTAIQVNAAVDPGQSGAPLVTSDGNVIGITTLSLEPDQTRITAVSLDTIRPILDQLEQQNNLHWLGLNVGPLPTNAAIPPQSGLFVFAVASGSPAAGTGVQPGDFITEIGGMAVDANGTAAYCRALNNFQDGDLLEISILRDGETLTGQINGQPLSGPSTSTATASATSQAQPSATLRPTNTASPTPGQSTNTPIPPTNTPLPPTSPPPTSPPPTSPPPTSPPPTSPPPTSPPPTSPPPTSPPPTNTPEPP